MVILTRCVTVSWPHCTDVHSFRARSVLMCVFKGAPGDNTRARVTRSVHDIRSLGSWNWAFSTWSKTPPHRPVDSGALHSLIRRHGLKKAGHLTAPLGKSKRLTLVNPHVEYSGMQVPFNTPEHRPNPSFRKYTCRALGCTSAENNASMGTLSVATSMASSSRCTKMYTYCSSSLSSMPVQIRSAVIPVHSSLSRSCGMPHMSLASVSSSILGPWVW
mmetsp:Transcript_77488/g.237170  ORF Transcript_77488/g.237170 Transcript_77488/m.237170 type:complete len:217 (-) Transcript_77488:505-1155(-)